MIDRYLLRYFLAVIDQGNFSRAAIHCRVSQPTLSVGIAKLETLLDQSLFVRTNRRVELTAAGTRLATHARRIEAEFAEAERPARDRGAGTLIRLGIVSSLPTAWIETALSAARGAAEGERIEIVEGAVKTLMPLLDRGRVDAVLGPVGRDPRARAPLYEEGYAMMLPAAHPLATRETIAAEEVAGEPMIVRRHCEMLSDTSRHFTSRGVRPFMAARTVSDDRAIAYVRAGIGITVMPRCFAAAGLATPALVGFDARRAIGFIVEPASVALVEASASVAAIGTAIRAVQAASSAFPCASLAMADASPNDGAMQSARS